MKFNVFAGLAFSVSLCMASCPDNAQGQLSVSNFEMTSTSVLFDLSGTLPLSGPVTASEGFFFVNPNESESPGFALGDFLPSTSNEFTGPQPLRGESDFSPIATGGIDFGDYFFVVFQNPLVPGEAISGRVTANWNSQAFDPTAVSSLNVYWGAADDLSLTTGVLVDTVTVGVPEPAAATLIGAFLVGTATVRRRRF